MRTLGFPNTPRTAARGRNAGKRYTSTSRRAFPIANSCQVFEPSKTPQALCHRAFNKLYVENSSTRSADDPLLYNPSWFKGVLRVVPPLQPNFEPEVHDPAASKPGLLPPSHNSRPLFSSASMTLPNATSPRQDFQTLGSLHRCLNDEVHLIHLQGVGINVQGPIIGV
jgi:hypothetical protein